MNYGLSRNAGHGWRRPSYEWVPSFYPRRPRRPRHNKNRRRKDRRSGRQDWYPSSYRAPSVSLVEALLSYPSLRTEAAGEPLDLDPVRNLVEAACVALGVSALVLFALWPAAVSLGLVAAAVGRLLARTRGVDKAVDIVCEQASIVHRINRRTSVNPPPSAEALETAWKATRGGRRGDPAVLAARLRLGAMLSDLEPAVDQSYIRDADGTVVGRQPGLRGWIAFNAPALLPHYKTLMGYKALADKLRVALEIEEPDTLDRALDLNPQQVKISVDEAGVGEPSATMVAGKCKTVAEKGSGGSGKSRKGRGNQPLERVKISVKSGEMRVRRAYREMFGEESGEGFPGTMSALEAAVRERLGKVWMRRRRKRRAA